MQQESVTGIKSVVQQNHTCNPCHMYSNLMCAYKQSKQSECHLSYPLQACMVLPLESLEKNTKQNPQMTKGQFPSLQMACMSMQTLPKGLSQSLPELVM